jgi:hypothetical protein
VVTLVKQISHIVINRNLKNAYVFSKRWSTVTENATNIQYPWIHDVIDKQDALTIVPSYKPTHSKKDQELLYGAITSIYDMNRGGGTVGALIVNFDTKMIKNAYARYREEIKGDIMIFNKTGHVIYDSAGKYYNKEYPHFSTLKRAEGSMMLDEEYLVSVDFTGSMDLMVVNITPKRKILEGINQMKANVYKILAIVTLVLMLISYFVSMLL